MQGLKTSGDVLFILLGAVMVLAMHAGFAFLELGTVRRKNQVNALMKILVDFSISTIASSTSTPDTRLRASSVMKLSVKPIRLRIQKVGIADSGIASAEMAVARLSRRNRNTTATASTAPSIIERIAAL